MKELIETIFDNLSDIAPVLIYADWAEENDDEALAKDLRHFPLLKNFVVHKGIDGGSYDCDDGDNSDEVKHGFCDDGGEQGFGDGGSGSGFGDGGYGFGFGFGGDDISLWWR